MEEDEWLSCAEPNRMLNYLRGMVSDRKLRLFAYNCWLSVRPLLHDIDRYHLRQARSQLERNLSESVIEDSARGAAILRRAHRCSILARVNDAFWVATASAQRCVEIAARAEGRYSVSYERRSPAAMVREHCV